MSYTYCLQGNREFRICLTVVEMFINLVSLKILRLSSKSLRILYTVTAFFSVLNDHSEDRKEAITQGIGSSKEVSTWKFNVNIFCDVIFGYQNMT